jgi:hypothetical protein
VLASTALVFGSGGAGGRRGGTGAAGAAGVSGPVLAAVAATNDPALDFDGDGVTDSEDACITTPRGPSDSNADGCPDRPAKVADVDGGGTADTLTPSATPDALAPTIGASMIARVFSPIDAAWRAGKKFTLVRTLRVRNVPAGAAIDVLCRRKGKGCPFKAKRLTYTSGVATVDLAKLFGKQAHRRRLRPGTTVEVRITAPGQIGKVARFVVRKSKGPKVTALCLPPGSTTPGRCS